jgi:hypothetical protein
LDGQLNIGEVHYFFQLDISNTTHTLALVSVFSEPNLSHFRLSNKTVWSCKYFGDVALKVIDAKLISAVVAMIPHELPDESGVQRWFMMEMPGLDVAQMGGMYEEILEE